jgi:hypothetical protein
MRWEKLLLCGSFGWITLLLAMLAYLIFSTFFQQGPDGWTFGVVAGVGWLIGALAMAVSEFYLDRRSQRRRF